MSRSGTPTLLWAIPMYQLMQESLTDNIVDHSLPSHMRTACRKALDKLEHYYDMAKSNHFNILAMSKYSQSASTVRHNTHTHGQLCIPRCNYPGLSWSTTMLTSTRKRYWNTTIPNTQRQCPLRLHLHCPMSPLLHQITRSWPALLITPSLVLPLSQPHRNLCPNANNTWPWSTEWWISKHSIPPCFGGRYNHSCNMSSAYFSLNLWLRLIKPSSPFSCIWHMIFLQSPEQWCQLNASSHSLDTSAPTNSQAWRWPCLHRLYVWKNGCERDSWGGTECFEAVVYVLRVSCNFFAVLNMSCISLVYKLFINNQIHLFTVYV